MAGLKCLDRMIKFYYERKFSNFNFPMSLIHQACDHLGIIKKKINMNEIIYF